MKYESKYGFIIPSQISCAEEESHDLKNYLVLFKLNDITYKGKILWFGTINNFKAFGIEMSQKTEFGTNGTFNNFKLFKCEDLYGVIVKDSVKILRIDKFKHYVINNCLKDMKNVKCTDFNSEEIVVVGINEELKIGKYCDSIIIDDIYCHIIEFMNDAEQYIYAKNDILGKFTDKNGIVISTYPGKYSDVKSIQDSKYKLKDNINLQCGSIKVSGSVKWVGTIDKYRCLGIYPENTNLISNFGNYLNISSAYWTLVCLDKLESLNKCRKSKECNYKIPENFREVENPKDENIFTYFNLKKFIQVYDNGYFTDGVVEKYVCDETNKFFYGIKSDDKDVLEFVPLDKVRCYRLFNINEQAFFEIKEPSECGITSIFRIGDHVQINPTPCNNLKETCLGYIIWMGIDNDFVFKFYIRLDELNEAGGNGILYNQKICDVDDKCGLLVLPGCLLNIETKSDPPIIIKQYTMPRFKISIGDNKGIQGDKNSCYLDTSVFAMFTFQELFDNLLMKTPEIKNDAGADVQEILGSHIIFPLRNNEYVSHTGVSIFREKLGVIFPNKKFLHSERDPEELMESLFHLLTPNDPLLNTFEIKTRTIQSCFLTQLFFMAQGLNTVSIDEMMNRTFLESNILINKPPKCLILQLPRDGNQYKQYKEVTISMNLDITHLIRFCSHACENCRKEALLFCKSCSETHTKFTYYCPVHSKTCNHDKFYIGNENKRNSVYMNSMSTRYESDNENMSKFTGKVILKLFAILCIEKTHYVAYVKTGEVTNKWIYFDSMGKFDNGELKPIIRESFIESYLTSGKPNSKNEEDVERIKRYAFVCFYKNPAMEFYSRDFNHINEN